MGGRPMRRRTSRRALLRAASLAMPAVGLMARAIGAPEFPPNDGSPPARVAVGYLPGAARYPEAVPFDPPERYPEYPYADDPAAGSPNDAYAVMREALRAWSPEGFGRPDWNPL